MLRFKSPESKLPFVAVPGSTRGPMSANHLQSAVAILGGIDPARRRLPHVPRCEFPPSPIRPRPPPTPWTCHGHPGGRSYRWLEDETARAPAWVEAENAVTFRHLNPSRTRTAAAAAADGTLPIRPVRGSQPIREADNFFFTRVRGLENQTVLLTADSLEAEPVVCWIRIVSVRTGRSP